MLVELVAPISGKLPAPSAGMATIMAAAMLERLAEQGEQTVA